MCVTRGTLALTRQARFSSHRCVRANSRFAPPDRSLSFSFLFSDRIRFGVRIERKEKRSRSKAETARKSSGESGAYYLRPLRYHRVSLSLFMQLMESPIESYRIENSHFESTMSRNAAERRSETVSRKHGNGESEETQDKEQRTVENSWVEQRKKDAFGKA